MLKTLIARQGDTLYDLCIKAYGDMRGLPYLLEDNPNLTREVESTSGGVKCIAANNEYMSSQSQNYLGSIIDDISINIDFSDFVPESTSNFFMQQGELVSTRYFWVNYINSTESLQFILRNGGTIFNLQSTIVGGLPLSGNIKIVGNGNDVELYLDDILQNTSDATSVGGISDLVGMLYFNTNSEIGIKTSATYENIKIGTNEWTFPEGSGATTTSSEGTITTLHTDNIEPADYLGTDYIEVNFTPTTGDTIELKQIDFTPFMPTGGFFETWRYSLAYSLNSDFSNYTVLMEGVDLESTNNVLVNHVLSQSVTLTDANTIYIRWFPYAGEFTLGQFNLNTTNPLFKGSVNTGADSTFLEWGLDISNTTFTASNNTPQYALGSGLNNPSTGTWNQISQIVYLTDAMWQQGSVIDLGFTGEVIIYDDSLRFKTVESAVFIPQREFLDDYLVYENQSIYDLAIQLYGSAEVGLKEIIPVVQDIQDGKITQGSLIKRKVPVSTIGKQFNNNDVLVATSPIIVPFTGVTFDYEFDFEF